MLSPKFSEFLRALGTATGEMVRESLSDALAEGDGKGRKARHNDKVDMEAILHPTRTGLRRDKAKQELAVMAAEAKGAPPEFTAAVKKHMREAKAG